VTGWFLIAAEEKVCLVELMLIRGSRITSLEYGCTVYREPIDEIKGMNDDSVYVHTYLGTG
jgi:hypothetical protein